MRIHFRRLSAVLAAGLLLTACGPRISDAEIASNSGVGPATLAPSALNQVREAAAAGAASSAATATTASAPAPAAAAPAQTSTTAAAAPAAVASTGHAAPATKGAAQSAATGRAAPAAAGKTSTTAAGTTPAKSAVAAVAPTGAAATCTKVGSPVNVGQVGTFSGVTGPAWSGGRTAVAVWAKDVNARGGLACHPVRLFFGDDGGDPARASALVAQFAHDDQVVAFVGGHLDFSMAGFQQAIETAKVAGIGGDLVAPEWYGASQYLFPQGAGIDDQLVGILKQNAAAGKTKVGLLYCVEVKACTHANQVLPGLAKSAGASIVYSSAISLTQTDFTAQCQSGKSAGADQLALAMDGTAMARVARSCAAIDYHPLLGGIGGTISPGQAKDPTLRQFGLATATGDAPWTESSTPGLKAYQDALTKYAPGEESSGSSVQMWAAAKLLEAAVAHLGASAADMPLTAALVVQGLHKLHNETLGGLTTGLTFDSGLPHSSGCVFYELLGEKGWTAPSGAKPFCH